MNSHIAVTNTDGAIVRRRTIHSDQVIRSEQSEAEQSASEHHPHLYDCFDRRHYCDFWSRAAGVIPLYVYRAEASDCYLQGAILSHRSHYVY